MRLLYVTTHPLVPWWFLRGQNQFLTKKGVELFCITSHGQYFEKLAKRDDMIMHVIEIPRAIVPHRDLIALIKIFLVIRKVRPDIVHLSTPKGAFLGALGSWAARVPARIFLIRGLTSDAKKGIARKFFKILELLTVRFCNVHYCVSKSLLDQARKNGILRSHKGDVVGPGMSNGIDCKRFDMANVQQEFDLVALRKSLNIPETSRVVGYVGRLTKDKGLCELLETWKLLTLKFLDTYLLLVGEWWEQVDVVPAQVREAFEKDSRVRITGYVDNPAPYYALMTVLCFPSHREGFPNVPMEASAMEIPVVATEVVGSVDAVMDGITGTLVELGDNKAFATAVIKYLSDPKLCRQHGAAGRKRIAEYFRQEIIWEELFSKYVTLLGNGIHAKH